MAHDVITLAHGAGGRLSRALTEEVILPALGNALLNGLHDGVVLPAAGRIAFTTDSYVVQPHFFPGGSIGRLAVCGTVNDLAMTGARAQYLSLALILEEGFPMETLRRVVEDIRTAAAEADVRIVTGDTKVVPRGTGVGILLDEEAIPVRDEVQGVCDLLGFDPLTLANEGKLLAFVPPEDTARVRAVMRADPHGTAAARIGRTTADAPGTVGIRTPLGGIRVVDMPAGELVPRIC